MLSGMVSGGLTSPLPKPEASGSCRVGPPGRQTMHSSGTYSGRPKARAHGPRPGGGRASGSPGWSSRPGRKPQERRLVWERRPLSGGELVVNTLGRDPHPAGRLPSRVFRNPGPRRVPAPSLSSVGPCAGPSPALSCAVLLRVRGAGGDTATVLSPRPAAGGKVPSVAGPCALCLNVESCQVKPTNCIKCVFPLT